MEIKLSAGDKINIPENCKATIENDLIIIEEKQEEFKDGDILIARDTGLIVVFKNYQNADKTVFCSYYNNDNRLNLNWITHYFLPATEGERQAFFDELKAKGLKWNEETKQMERIRKRVEKGVEYLYINGNCDILEVEDFDSLFDDRLYNLGNYYLPEEREQAEEDAKAIRAIFEKRLKV